jgi:flagellar biosynthesis/type III secretory pathway protein FliH
MGRRKRGKGRRVEGKKEGREEGRKGGKKEGREEGRKEGREGGRKKKEKGEREIYHGKEKFSTHTCNAKGPVEREH